MKDARCLPLSIILVPFTCHVLAVAAFAAWSTDPTLNTAICTANGDQVYAAAISDGARAMVDGLDAAHARRGCRHTAPVHPTAGPMRRD